MCKEIAPSRQQTSQVRHANQILAWPAHLSYHIFLDHIGQNINWTRHVIDSISIIVSLYHLIACALFCSLLDGDLRSRKQTLCVCELHTETLEMVIVVNKFDFLTLFSVCSHSVPSPHRTDKLFTSKIKWFAIAISIDIIPHVIGFRLIQIGEFLCACVACVCVWLANMIVIDKYVSTCCKIIAWCKNKQQQHHHKSIDCLCDCAF